VRRAFDADALLMEIARSPALKERGLNTVPVSVGIPEKRRRLSSQANRPSMSAKQAAPAATTFSSQSPILKGKAHSGLTQATELPLRSIHFTAPHYLVSTAATAPLQEIHSQETQIFDPSTEDAVPSFPNNPPKTQLASAAAGSLSKVSTLGQRDLLKSLSERQIGVANAAADDVHRFQTTSSANQLGDCNDPRPAHLTSPPASSELGTEARNCSLPLKPVPAKDASTSPLPRTAVNTSRPTVHTEPSKNDKLDEHETYWCWLLRSHGLESIINVSRSTKFGLKTGWCPMGELRREWNITIFGKVMSIHDQNAKYIWKGIKKRKACLVSLWMISEEESWESAHATIVIQCVNEAVSKRIIRTLERNPLFKDYELGFKFLAWQGDLAHPAGPTNIMAEDELVESDSLSLCGVRVVIINVPVSTESRWNSATIGGVLLLDGAYYGLSVAHAFYPLRDELSPDPLEDHDPEELPHVPGAFGPVSDREETEDDPSCPISQESDSSWSEESALQAKPSRSVVYLARGEGELSQTRVRQQVSKRFLANLSLVGFLPMSDFVTYENGSQGSQWISLDLDWALVRIHDPRFWVRNQCTTSTDKTVSITFVSYSPPYGTVLINTSPTPQQSCGLGCKSGIILPNSQTMQEVWGIGSASRK
jgi:hypothetical protein